MDTGINITTTTAAATTDLVVQFEVFAVKVGRELLGLHRRVCRHGLLDGEGCIDDVKHLGNRLHFRPLPRFYQRN